jgi:hypothetical protein
MACWIWCIHVFKYFCTTLTKPAIGTTDVYGTVNSQWEFASCQGRARVLPELGRLVHTEVIQLDNATALLLLLQGVAVAPNLCVVGLRTSGTVTSSIRKAEIAEVKTSAVHTMAPVKAVVKREPVPVNAAAVKLTTKEHQAQKFIEQSLRICDPKKETSQPTNALQQARRTLRTLGRTLGQSQQSLLNSQQQSLQQSMQPKCFFLNAVSMFADK